MDGVMEGEREEEAVVEGDKDAREDPVGARSVGVGVGVEQELPSGLLAEKVGAAWVGVKLGVVVGVELFPGGDGVPPASIEGVGRVVRVG